MKPERWANPSNKIFPYQVGFTSPPHDFDAAVSDFLRISPRVVGAHGRMLHLKEYQHQLAQRKDNFHLLEEFVECMSNNGADVCGQVGTNWVHAGGKTPGDIRQFCDRMSDTYQTPLHMAGMCLVEGLRELNVEKVALNSVYFWPDWRDGIARFLRDAGFDLVYVGNVVDQGFYKTQQEVNDLTWIFPGELAEKSMQYVAEQAPTAEAIVVNGMPNFRQPDGLPVRMVSIGKELEEAIDKPIVSSDFALYWRIFKTLGVRPEGEHGRLLSSLI
ncbi:MAG: maleate cis-trans isomerase [Parasphingorhabdus sp.]|jgi:maleate cis-trans isomerase